MYEAETETSDSADAAETRARGVQSAETLSGKLIRLAAQPVPMKPRRAARRSPLVTISFDDCFASAIDNGARILEELGVRGTFFFARDLCAGRFNQIPYYTQEQLRRVAKAGHEVGCHSTNHSPFVSQSLEAMEDDWRTNEAFLKEVTGTSQISSFSYPYGYFDLQACYAASRRFAACRGTRLGINRRWMDMAKLRANPIGPEWSRLSRSLQLLKRVDSQGGWLIFYTHDVSDNPSPFGCTPTALRTLIRQIQEAGIEILPMKDAAKAFASAS